jgi:hypothetical protein
LGSHKPDLVHSDHSHSWSLTKKTLERDAAREDQLINAVKEKDADSGSTTMMIERAAFQIANAALSEDLLITRLEWNKKESSSQLLADQRVMQANGVISHTNIIKALLRHSTQHQKE